MKHTRLRSVGTLGVTFALLACVGCGDGDDSGSASVSRSPAPPAGFTVTAAQTARRTPSPFATDGAAATPTATPPTTPAAGTVTATPAVSGTPTVSRTPTPTFAARAQGRLRIGRVSGAPGDIVPVDVMLDVEDGAEIAGTQNDLLYDSSRIAVISTAAGGPDCAVNPAIDKGQTVFGFLAFGCGGVPECGGMRAIVLSFQDANPIARGSRLYTCNVRIAPDAENGSVDALTCAEAMAASPAGNAIEIECEDGEVMVGGAVVETPTPSPTRTCASTSPTPPCPPEQRLCNDPQCGSDCVCVPPTRTPTASSVLTPTLGFPSESCRCLENGGQPGPGHGPCNVGQCFSRCVDNLCPGTPNSMLECSFRCSCNRAPPGCPTHEDPGSTPTSVP